MQSNSTIVNKLFSLFLPYKQKLLIILACLIFYILFSLSLPIFNSYLIDKGIIGKDYNLVVSISLCLFLLVLLNSLASIIKEKARATIASCIRQRLVMDAFRGLSRVDIRYFNSRNSAEIITNLEMDTSRICTICDSDFFMIITQLVGFIGGITGLFLIDYRLAFIVLIFIPLKFLIVSFLAKKRKYLIKKLIDADHKFGRWIGESLDGMKEIRLFGLYNKKSEELKDIIFNRADSEKNINILDNYNLAAENIILRLLESILYMVGALFILSDTMTIGSLVAFLTYSSQVTNPISAALNISFIMSGIFPSAQRYFDLLDSKEELENNGILSICDVHNIAFDNVSFAYDNKCILKGINLFINNGEKVAIIGKNGTGKTTIFHLIERFLTPTSGEILVNGVNVKEYEIDSYRNAFACINQDSYLFNMTILDNITLYSCPTKKLLDCVMAQADIHPLLKSCQGMVGINGQNLSGGQRQKIIFSRMLLREKSCYLLDEATSNLDKESEMIVAQAFQTFLKDKTVLLIAHNVELLRYMDRIIQLDGAGGIIEYRSYDELLASMPDIKNLFNHA